MKKSAMTNDEYVTRRKSLIPQAEKICSKASVLDKQGRRGAKWSQLFLKVMDRLWLLETLKEQQSQMANELARVNSRISAVSGDLEKVA